jgi:hypothetical protein
MNRYEYRALTEMHEDGIKLVHVIYDNLLNKTRSTPMNSKYACKRVIKAIQEEI